jgi:hypothetical protein
MSDGIRGALHKQPAVLPCCRKSMRHKISNDTIYSVMFSAMTLFRLTAFKRRLREIYCFISTGNEANRRPTSVEYMKKMCKSMRFIQRCRFILWVPTF